jgi:hypothetical protein
MDGDPDASGTAGVLRVADEPERVVGDELVRFAFGTAGSSGLTPAVAPGSGKSGTDKGPNPRGGEDDSRSKEN